MAQLTDYLAPAALAKIRRLDLRAKFIVDGFRAGLHQATLQGLSHEFDEHRKYVKGDDLRMLDWHVLARTNRLYIRQHTAETNLDCHLFIDNSASMSAVATDEHAGAGRKRQYCINLGAALAYLAMSQRDRVGLTALAERPDIRCPPRARHIDVTKLLASLEALSPDGVFDPRESIGRALGQIRQRGLVVLLSDLLVPTDALRHALHHIRFQGHDLIVLHILDEDEVDFPYRGAVELVDPESGTRLRVAAETARTVLAERLETWRNELEQLCGGIRADYVPLDTRTPFDVALSGYLRARIKRA